MESTTEYANASRVSDTEGFMRETPERTLSLTVSYNGAPFSGFARQPGHLTVQGELEQALSLVFRRPMEVVCSGRTDAGVHALGQGLASMLRTTSSKAGTYTACAEALMR